MLIRNKLDKSFGPVGSSAGVFLFITGIIVTYSSLFGLVPVLLGAFIGFSSTCSIIDTDRKRIKFSNNLFGIIQTGKWIQIDETMKLGIKESKITWTAHSRGDRTLDIDNNDFRISLFNSGNDEIMEITKTDSPEKANTITALLAGQLGIGIH